MRCCVKGDRSVPEGRRQVLEIIEHSESARNSVSYQPPVLATSLAQLHIWLATPAVARFAAKVWPKLTKVQCDILSSFSATLSPLQLGFVLRYPSFGNARLNFASARLQSASDRHTAGSRIRSRATTVYTRDSNLYLPPQCQSQSPNQYRHPQTRVQNDPLRSVRSHRAPRKPRKSKPSSRSLIATSTFQAPTPPKTVRYLQRSSQMCKDLARVLAAASFTSTKRVEGGSMSD